MKEVQTYEYDYDNAYIGYEESTGKVNIQLWDGKTPQTVVKLELSALDVTRVIADLATQQRYALQVAGVK